MFSLYSHGILGVVFTEKPYPPFEIHVAEGTIPSTLTLVSNHQIRNSDDVPAVEFVGLVPVCIDRRCG